MVRSAALVFVIGALGGCPRVQPEPRELAGPSSDGRLMVPGAAVAIYAYAEVIAAYPAEDRGAYVVRLAAGPDGDRVRAGLDGHLDDVVDDGHAIRLGPSERDAMREEPGVVAVVPLQPAQRRSARAPMIKDGQAEVRIDLFTDVGADEVAAIRAWIAWRGGTVTWQGPTALTARLPVDAIAAAARLSPVRWVE